MILAKTGNFQMLMKMKKLKFGLINPVSDLLTNRSGIYGINEQVLVSL